MKNTSKYLLLGLGHGINDCIAGYIIGNLYYHHYSSFQIGVYTLTYNLIAFGGQLVVARILESFFFPKQNFLLSFSLLTLSLLLLPFFPPLSILFAGIASALFHVTGGLEASRRDDKAFGIGIFASPGVLGLILGGFLSYQHIDFGLIGIVICLVYGFIVYAFYQNTSQNAFPYEDAPPSIEQHDIIMCVLITILSLRSLVWDIVQMAEQNNYKWLIVIAFAAMLGKILGGIISDKVGHKKYSIYALLLAIPFLSIFKKNLLGMSMGVFLLQSTIPSTTVLILKMIKDKPAVGISLSFGISIIFAGILLYSPLMNLLSNQIVIGICLVFSLVLLFLYGYLRKSIPQK